MQVMPPTAPLAELPESVSFSLDEVARILFAVDLAAESTVAGTFEHVVARAAQQVITERLWPDLGRLLRDTDEQED